MLALPLITLLCLLTTTTVAVPAGKYTNSDNNDEMEWVDIRPRGLATVLSSAEVTVDEINPPRTDEIIEETTFVRKHSDKWHGMLIESFHLVLEAMKKLSQEKARV